LQKKHSMDITRTFKATIKAVRMRKKVTSEDGADVDISKDIFKKHTPSVFKQRSKEIARSITELKEIIIETSNKFNGYTGLLFASKVETEEEAKVDKDIQYFMKSCASSIRSLKNDITGDKSQISLHRKAVIQLLHDYLKAVCKIYGQQKAIKVKRAVDRKKMSRLSSMPWKENQKEETELQSPSREKTVINQDVMHEKSSEPDRGLENLSKEEIQKFEEENKMLLNELNDLVDEVKQIEGKVIEISQLQEIFSEKVLDQASQIEKVNETTISTTENVKEGNENIREAIKNSATFRVWILFFLVMCTFSLLFLDWYNQ